MPKVKPLGSEDMKRIAIARQTNSAKADEDFRFSVELLITYMRTTRTKLAEILGLDNSKQLKYRMEDPQNRFSLHELRILDSLSKQYGAGVSFL